jgi:pimeloyl-CoA synthetase
MAKIFLFTAFLFLFACKKQNENYDEIALVYAELRIAEREYGEAEDGKAARLQILQKYGFSAEVFEEKMEGIKKENETWLEFQKTLMKILDSIAESNKTEGEP